jgi:rsbT co-antagonist protein RsbR
VADSVLKETDLARFAHDGAVACWVQDIDQFRVHWANHAAACLLDAASIEELYARDLRPLSKATATRLQTYRDRVAQGETVTTQWTVFPKGSPVTILAEIKCFRFSDARLRLFFSARSIAADTCAETLRMLEAARQSSAAFSLFRFDGAQLERNAAFFRAFGGSAGEDTFAQLFFDDSEGVRIRSIVTAEGEYRGRALLLTANGPRWHMLIASPILDPVDGQALLHVECVDIDEQIMAELRAREAESLLQRISDEFRHPVAHIDRNRRFRFLNKTYSRWLQRPAAEIIGRTIAEVSGEEADQLWLTHWPKLE